MKEEIVALRKYLREKKIDFFIQKNTDPFLSEYVSNHYRIVRYLSGFSGSNATLLVTENKAYLWTDGRYFIQAQNELNNSGITLMKSGVSGVLSPEEFLDKNLKKSQTIGFDGKYISQTEYEKYKNIAEKKKAKIRGDLDIFDKIWTERPKPDHTEIFILSPELSGKSTAHKSKALLKTVKEAGADAAVFSDLCDIAYFLNLRAKDIPNVLVFYSYLYFSKKKTVLFIDKERVREDIAKYLATEIHGIEIEPIDSVYSFLSGIKHKKILADKDRINASLAQAIENKNILIAKKSPLALMRAVKNKTEIKNTILAHKYESAVITRLIYELKTGKLPLKSITETDIDKRLTSLRKEVKGYICDSFDTIAAYGKNAAMMHYNPYNGENAVIGDKGFLLIDTGGHYSFGTTDTTRTIALGSLSQEEKYNYTLCLKGHLALMNAVFLKGTSGENLDILARAPFWNELKDFRSGTGHGVGHLLSVHEGPNAVRTRYTKDTTPLCPGMITTDEPGFYEEGKYGIRIENELLCITNKKSEYGQFYKFFPLTLVPYEPSAIILSMLSSDEKLTLNKYNKYLYKTLSTFLDEDVRDWLKKEISKVK